ncbi:MAG: 50S ribosomal protein L19 [Candidatus Azambacteria bacterium]|nr:50S ribosomal protein L19 [Candidatus Azambacteria bacterium]
MEKIKTFDKKNLRTDVPELKSGMKVRVWQKIKEADKERLQAFEGVVIAVKHGRGKSGTFTVRKISSGVGVERIFPLHAPTFDKIEVLSQAKTRRAKIYYLRGLTGKKAKMKQVEFSEAVAPEAKPVEEVVPETVVE